ncbi:MAG: hypothetical protein MPJ50_09955 [Pirellulales bacterium]|nr:hypothetical protein [Pirellulales bacterium]
MARSENQGIQIALIVFAFMFILATVGFIYYISENSKNVAAAETAKNNATAAESKARDASAKWAAACEKLGIEPTATLQDVETEWNSNAEAIAKQMANSRSSGNENDEASSGLDAFQVIQKLDEALKKKAREVQENKNELADLKVQLEELRDADATKIANIEKEFAKATKAHQDAVDNFGEIETQLRNTIEQLTTDLRVRDGEKTELETQLVQAQQKYQTDITDLEEKLERATYQLAILRNESFTEPDGIIRLVDQRSETVWINLGSADNLRPQITFSIWDKDTTGLARDGMSRKGALEVMRVDGPHSAEARITQQDSLNPIVPGDLISTPLWRPGERLGFALVGSLDIDDDSISDRERIVQLITSNGGTLHAEQTAEGIEGEMTVNTRYIIVGPSEPGQEEAVSSMLREADRMGIQRISLADFLERSGYRKSRDTKNFGASAKISDFDDLPVDNNRFRTRRPPSGIDR